ncbi:terminase large subunit domain-containing protein [Larkinella sp. GY13]|uniref:terminase large subunit domain-containing protein n=1 Tax=Larkinella sp. GY13 TaxID=3453720 RepID=UPI003EE8E457
MPTLNVPQARFLAMPQKFRGFIGGFGTGKTWVGCAALCQHHWEFPKVNSGYFAPTYPQIKDIFFPTIEEVAFDWGLKTRIKVTDKEVSLYSGRQYRGTIICRTMDNPSNIVGFKIGKAHVDEIDVMEAEKAQQAWRKIIARMRYNVPGLKNGIDITTTPEGFKFAYELLVKNPREKPSLADLYGMVQASTYENEANLPDDYIFSLFQTYPSQLIDAYLRGQFVNLTAGSVYPNFDRFLSHTNETMNDGEDLEIGMDFNVMNMTAIINVIRNGKPRTVAELTGVRDTPTMARMLNERYKQPGRAIRIYPDASGQAHKSVNASESDLSILRQNSFTVVVDSTNPAVKDRVNAVNAMILNAKGERRWLVNTKLCPRLTETLEQQAYDKNGEPDKENGLDHPNDAQGYFICKKWPIVKRVIGRARMAGV